MKFIAQNMPTISTWIRRDFLRVNSTRTTHTRVYRFTTCTRTNYKKRPSIHIAYQHGHNICIGIMYRCNKMWRHYYAKCIVGVVLALCDVLLLVLITFNLTRKKHTNEKRANEIAQGNNCDPLLLQSSYPSLFSFFFNGILTSFLFL